jgi:hypothetical protein
MREEAALRAAFLFLFSVKKDREKKKLEDGSQKTEVLSVHLLMVRFFAAL